MTRQWLFSTLGLVLTSAGAIAMYAASEHQRLVRNRQRAWPYLSAGGVLMVPGIAAWVASWGGLVGGLLALSVWMTVSIAMPYLLARRSL